MIKVENIETWGFQHAIRGMRNPMNSWDNSDSGYGIDGEDEDIFVVGKNDLKLMQKLYKAGPEHRKYLRQIFVSMDITSNHTFWAEMDTYKVGPVKNSCSKMHRIHTKTFEPSDFTNENIMKISYSEAAFKYVVTTLERLRIDYNTTHDKDYWRAMIDLLPMGYNLRATVTMNYENVFNIIHQRSGHKLDEWNVFCEILKELPYVKEILSGRDKEKSEI